jgi:hypothetical protein
MSIDLTWQKGAQTAEGEKNMISDGESLGIDIDLEI